MNKLLLIIVLTTTITACTLPQPRPYYQAGQSTYTSSKDTMECRRMALQEVQNSGMGNNMFAEIPLERITGECMRGLGYRR
jgi:hypothetical protein